jgi:uncharacterized membrane protein YdjX (TVP38/TMEM64 family)
MPSRKPFSNFIFWIKQIGFRRESFLLLAFAVLPLLSGTGLAIWAIREQAYLMEFSFMEWTTAFGLLSFLLAFSLIPNTLAGMVAGYLLGFWALPGMFFSYILASIWGYFGAGFFDRGLKEEILSLWPSSRAFFKHLETKSERVVFAFRFLPIPPFAIGNLVLAWSKIPFPSFFWGSFLGMLPRMSLVVWLGKSAQDILYLLKNPGSASELSWLSAFGLLAALFLWFWLKRIYRKNSS